MNTNITNKMNIQSKQARKELRVGASRNLDQEKTIRSRLDSGEMMVLPPFGKPKVTSKACEGSEEKKVCAPPKQKVSGQNEENKPNELNASNGTKGTKEEKPHEPAPMFLMTIPKDVAEKMMGAAEKGNAKVVFPKGKDGKGAFLLGDAGSYHFTMPCTEKPQGPEEAKAHVYSHRGDSMRHAGFIAGNIEMIPKMSEKISANVRQRSREAAEAAKKKRMLRMDDIGAPESKVKRGCVRSTGVTMKQVQIAAGRKPTGAGPSNLRSLRSKPAPARTNGRVSRPDRRSLLSLSPLRASSLRTDVHSRSDLPSSNKGQTASASGSASTSLLPPQAPSSKKRTAIRSKLLGLGAIPKAERKEFRRIVKLPCPLATRRQGGEGRMGSKVGRDGAGKRELTHPEERERKRVKTGEEIEASAARDMGRRKGERSDWSPFVGDDNRLVAEIEQLERRWAVSGPNDTRIRTGREANEVRERYESLYKVYIGGVKWIDDVAAQMKALEERYLGARSEEERRMVAERVVQKNEMGKEKHEKVSRIVPMMHERLKEMKNALNAWKRRREE